MGRFLSLDPLAADFPSWSDYNYVLGNPISFVDPDGKSPCCGPLEMAPWRIGWEGGGRGGGRGHVRPLPKTTSLQSLWTRTRNYFSKFRKKPISKKKKNTGRRDGKTHKNNPDDNFNPDEEAKKLQKLKKQMEGTPRTGTKTKENTKGQKSGNQLDDAAQQHDEIIKAHQNNPNAVNKTDKSKQNVKKAAREEANRINNQ